MLMGELKRQQRGLSYLVNRASSSVPLPMQYGLPAASRVHAFVSSFALENLLRGSQLHDDQ